MSSAMVYLLLQKGTKAPQAAGKIHTDFEKGFIMAEVMKFADFKEEGSENAVKVNVTMFLREAVLQLNNLMSLCSCHVFVVHILDCM